MESAQPAFAILIVALTLGFWSAISRIKVNKVVNLFRRPYEPIRILGNEGELERIESLLYRVWQGMKDEVEKDEADVKAIIKKRKAGEIRAANKAKRSESAGSATSTRWTP